MEGDKEEITREGETSTSGQRETGRSVERKAEVSKGVEGNKIQQLTESIQRVNREKKRLVETEEKWKQEQKERHEKEDEKRREVLERDLRRLEGEQEKLERREYEQRQVQEIEQGRKNDEEEHMRVYEQRVKNKDDNLEELRQELRDTRKDYKRETSRSVERKVGGNKMEEMIEKRFNKQDEKIRENKDQFQQIMAMMREDKQAREDKEAKEKQEKEQRRRQKEEKEQRGVQEMMQNFAKLENRIKDSELNFEEKIESMMKKNNEKLKEEMENKWVENKKQMEEKIDVQDRHFKESNKEMENRMNAQDNYLRGVAGQITQDKVEAKKNIGAMGNKIEGVERSIGTIEEKIKEVEFEQISQQEKIERVQQEIGTIRQGTGIENVRVMRPEVITQPPIYYGDYKVHPQKNKTNESQKHEQQLEDEDGQQMKEVNKTEELQNEIIRKQVQEQQAEEFTRKTMVLRKLNKTIKNISTGKTKAPTQVEIIYGERKFGPCKQTNNIQQHLRKIEQVNKEDDEEEIMANIQKIMKRKEGTWTRIQMKCKKVLSKKFWRILENKAHYPLLEGIKNEKCNIKEEHRARIQGNNKRKQIDSNITNNEFCQRNKRWRWSQESDDASERYKRRSLLRIYYQDTLI